MPLVCMCHPLYGNPVVDNRTTAHWAWISAQRICRIGDNCYSSGPRCRESDVGLSTPSKMADISDSRWCVHMYIHCTLPGARTVPWRLHGLWWGSTYGRASSESSLVPCVSTLSNARRLIGDWDVTLDSHEP